MAAVDNWRRLICRISVRATQAAVMSRTMYLRDTRRRCRPIDLHRCPDDNGLAEV